MTKAIPLVNLKDEEIKNIKEKNGQIDQENKTLKDKVDKQKRKLKGKLQLQGTRHLLWDKISVEVDNLWEYVNYIQDKRDLSYSILTKCKVVDEVYKKDLLIKLKVP